MLYNWSHRTNLCVGKTSFILISEIKTSDCANGFMFLSPRRVVFFIMFNNSWAECCLYSNIFTFLSFFYTYNKIPNTSKEKGKKQ